MTDNNQPQGQQGNAGAPQGPHLGTPGPPQGEPPHSDRWSSAAPQANPGYRGQYPGQQHPQQGPPQQYPQQGYPQQGQPVNESPRAQQVAKDLADGDWHRMHPLTPFLRGGIGLIVFAGIMLTWGRDRIIGLFMPAEYNYYDGEGDPISWLLQSGYFWLAIVGFIVVVLLFVAGFYFSWRKREFRVTGDVVELREGILSRRHRRAPLQRIQGIEVQKPWLARILGCAKLEIEQAGSDSKVELAYIGISVAAALREEILNQASGRAQQAAESGDAVAGAAPNVDARPGQQGRVGTVAQEFLRPDAELERYEHTLFKLSPGRLIGSSVLSLLPVGLFFMGIAIVAAIAIGVFSEEGALLALVVPLLSFLPALLAMTIATIGRVVSLMRFTVAKTQDGIRLSRGLATVTTQTVPPGRVFSLTISQPLMWRPFGWWKVAYGRATQQVSSSNDSNQTALRTTLLPVGNKADLFQVLSLVLSEEDSRYIIDQGLLGKGEPGDGFIVSPPRARAFRWFSRRRNGIHARDSMFVLRKGAIWRSADIMPAARVQSVGLTQGPIYGMAGLARIQFHTVGMLGNKSLGALDAGDAKVAFDHAYPTVRAAMVSDRSENWGISPAGASTGSPAVDYVGAQHATPGPAAQDSPPPSPAYPMQQAGFGGAGQTGAPAEAAAPFQPDASAHSSSPTQAGSPSQRAAQQARGPQSSFAPPARTGTEQPGRDVQFPDRPLMTHTPIAHPRPQEQQGSSSQAPPEARPGADGAPIDAVPQQWSRRNPPPAPDSGTAETEQRATSAPAANPEQQWSRRNPPPVPSPSMPSQSAPSDGTGQQQWSRRNPPPVANPMRQDSTPDDEQRDERNR